MKNTLSIGVGGSHISCAAYDLTNHMLLKKSVVSTSWTIREVRRT